MARNFVNCALRLSAESRAVWAGEGGPRVKLVAGNPLSGTNVVKSGTVGHELPSPGNEPGSSAECAGARPTLATRFDSGAPRLLGDSYNASSGMCPAAGSPYSGFSLGTARSHIAPFHGCPDA